MTDDPHILLTNAKLNRALTCNEGQKELKSLADSRQNRAIIEHLQQALEFGTDVIDDYEYVVLRLTCNDDPETLEKVLAWSRSVEGLEHQREEEGRKNPLLVSCLKDHQACTKLLHKHGFRLPQVEGSELKRQKIVQEVPTEENIVEKFILFQAYTNPHYLSLTFTEDDEMKTIENLQTEQLPQLLELDPLSRAFALASHAETMATFFSEYRTGYIECRDKLDKYTQEVLDQCDNLKEITEVLGHNEDDEDNANWQKALWGNNKGFVSHPYYQKFLWQKMKGKESRSKCFGNNRIIRNVIYMPLSVLLFCCYPFVVIADFFRKGDILFIPPEVITESSEPIDNSIKTKNTIVEVDNMDTKVKAEMMTLSRDHNPLSVFEWFRERIHRPVYRMLVHHFLEVLYLLLLFLTVYSDNKTDVFKVLSGDSYFILSLIFVIFYFINDIVNLFWWKSKYFTSFWNLYSLFTHTITILGIALSLYSQYTLDDEDLPFYRATKSGNDCANVGMSLFSVGITLSFLKLQRWLILLEVIGPIINCMIEVGKDAVRILCIYGIILFSYFIGFWSMLKPFRQLAENSTIAMNSEYKLQTNTSISKTELFSGLFWRVFSGGNLEFVTVNHMNASVSGGPEASWEFSHLIQLLMWVMFQFMSIILLLNLLIAIMSNTYGRIWENSSQEWKYSKTFYQVQFLHPSAVFPPPFRFLFYLAKLQFLSRTKPLVQVQVETRCYLNLLNRLVLTKQHTEFENTDKDMFRDLRTDIKYDLGEMIKKLGEGGWEINNINPKKKSDWRSMKLE